MVKNNPGVELTKREKEIFKELKNFAARREPPVVLRVAGGWVRDKLMGKKCSDIDIALDCDSGKNFAKEFRDFIKKESGSNIYGYHVISHNHEKAKHLETASMVYMGVSLDFVALRSEEYGNTRIPMTTVGTPLQDAERRDITINSLFYNLNTKKVEDHTGKGLADLQKKVIRTPVNPKKTFMDDPLRVLRVLRFAAKLWFTIAPEVLDSLHDQEVVQRLGQIISRERIGQETKKTFECPGYGRVLGPMVDTGIIGVIFEDVTVERNTLIRYYNVSSQSSYKKKTKYVSICPAEQKYVVNLFSVFQFFFRVADRRQAEDQLTKLLKKRLVWSNAQASVLVQTYRHAMFLSDTFGSVSYETRNLTEKKAVLVRICRELKEAYPWVRDVYHYSFQALNEHGPLLSPIDFVRLHEDIFLHGFQEAASVARVVTAREILSYPGLDVPIRMVGTYLEKAVEISLVHKITDKKEVLEMLLEHRLTEAASFQPTAPSKPPKNKGEARTNKKNKQEAPGKKEKR